MWLCPWLVPTSRVVAGSYYHVSVVGDRVPAAGPVLVVTNHPNMLLDPLLATAAAGRPLRFVAKSPLFKVPVLSTVLRAIGALPVYRRRDASVAAGDNGDALGRIIGALEMGDAVLIFPEGTSAAEGDILPFKSGASRILLAALRRGIVPRVIVAGLWYETRQRPGSRALIRLQEIHPFRDLPARPDDPVTTQTLTSRFERAVRALAAPPAEAAELRRVPDRWHGLLRPCRSFAVRAPMWIAHRIAHRLPVDRAERATQHLTIGLMVMLALWVLLVAGGSAAGGPAGALTALVGFPVMFAGGLACAAAWADDQRLAGSPAARETEARHGFAERTHRDSLEERERAASRDDAPPMKGLPAA